MAATCWDDAASVGFALEKTPWEFRFFQAVRLLRLFARQPESRLAGRNVEFNAVVSLAFPPSEIFELSIPHGDLSLDSQSEDVDRGIEPDPLLMVVAFMGLVGPSGVLPRHYTELLIQQEVTGNSEDACAFFDIFTHRAVELFYAAWEKYRFHLHFERGSESHLSRYLLDLVGMGFDAQQANLGDGANGLSKSMLAYYCGSLSDTRRSAAGLAGVLGDYFAIAVNIEQFRPEWVTIPLDSRLTLGATSSSLGRDSIIGDRVWDTQTTFRVVLGPMSASRYLDFLPHGKAFRALAEIVTWYGGVTLRAEVQLCLDAPNPFEPEEQSDEIAVSAWTGWRSVPESRLGQPQQGLWLGWHGWLGGKIDRPFADDCVMKLQPGVQ